MKNINLLPRKPLINQIYIPLMIAIVVIFVSCSCILLLYSFNSNTYLDAEQQKVDQANKRITDLTVLHQVDPRTQDYDSFAALLQQLKSGRRDWVPIFDLITKNLYKSSRLLTMEVNDKAVISLNLEFASLKDIAYYTVLLQNSTLVEQVSVKDISILKKSKVEDKTSVPLVEAGKSGNTIQTSTLSSYSVSMEIQLKSVVSGK